MESSSHLPRNPLVSQEILEQTFTPDFQTEEEDPFFTSAAVRVVGEDGQVDPYTLDTVKAVYQEMHRARLAVDSVIRQFGQDEARVGEVVGYFDQRIEQLIKYPNTPLEG